MPMFSQYSHLLFSVLSLLRTQYSTSLKLLFTHGICRTCSSYWFVKVRNLRTPKDYQINKQINVEKKKYLKEYCKYMYF